MLAAKLNESLLKEIAENLEMGMRCFLRKTSLELVCYPDPLKNLYVDPDVWAEQIGQIDAGFSDYIEIAAMNDRESFEVMESFVAGIFSFSIREHLGNALSDRKPFRAFKEQIMSYPEIRNDWFAYKLTRYMDYVRMQLAGLED